MENTNEFNRMQFLAGLITEEKQKFDYGCAMVYFDFPEMKEIHDMISEDHIYTQEGDRSFGLEDEPHCTLLYGLHEEVSNNDIKSIIDNYEFGACTISNPSLFENKDYDVLKFDVSGYNLNEINKELSKLPHTTDYPDYHPHMTIAYIKPGKGKIYTKLLKGKEYNLTPNKVIYSRPDGDQEEIKINTEH